MKHVVSTILLTALSLFICCIGYVLALWAFACMFFPSLAEGNLIAQESQSGGNAQGFHLIAQAFPGDEYFWVRPSAASYNGAAAGGSNWGANNPKLRDRVAQQLGPIIQYRKDSHSEARGRTPQQDLALWFAAKPDRAADLARDYPTAATATDALVAAAYFDMWLQDPANHEKVADLEPVPADMVTASGSGLDPHITLRNAKSVYQLDRVARRRTPLGSDPDRIRKGIADLLQDRAFVPLSGLLGEPLVNVLEINIDLDSLFPRPVQK